MSSISDVASERVPNKWWAYLRTVSFYTAGAGLLASVLFKVLHIGTISPPNLIALLVILAVPFGLLPVAFLAFSGATLALPKIDEQVIHFFGVNFFGWDFAFFILLALFIAAGRTQLLRNAWRMPIGKPLIIYLAWFGVSTIIAVLQGGGLNFLALYTARVHVNYMLFFIFIIAASNRKNLRLVALSLLPLILFEALVHFKLQFAYNPEIDDFFGHVGGQAGGGGVGRILAQGSFMLFYAFMPLVMSTLDRRTPLNRGVLIMLSVLVFVAIMFTFVRAYWFPAILAVLTFWLFLNPKNRAQYLKRVLVAGVLVTIAWLAISLLSTQGQSALSAFSYRISELTTRGIRSGTLVQRGLEYLKCWDAAKEHLIIGRGALTRVYLGKIGNAAAHVTENWSSSTHLEYLTVILHGGVIGLAIWFWLLGSILIYTLRLIKLTEGSWERMFWIGMFYSAVGNFMGMLVQANGFMDFTIPPWVLAMSVTSVRYIQLKYQVQDTSTWALPNEVAFWSRPELPTPAQLRELTAQPADELG